jgi:DNA-binding response OmpR family regulator
VVLDLNLPKKSGHEVLCDIREATAGWDLPVIVFTASNRPVDREKALSFGANRYIQKSLNLDGFIAVSQQVSEYVSSRPSAGPGKQS